MGIKCPARSMKGAITPGGLQCYGTFDIEGQYYILFGEPKQLTEVFEMTQQPLRNGFVGYLFETDPDELWEYELDTEYPGGEYDYWHK